MAISGFQWRKRDKPCVVAVLFAQGCGVVAAALFDLNDLGRTGFTAHCISKPATDTVCRAARFQYLSIARLTYSKLSVLNGI